MVIDRKPKLKHTNSDWHNNSICSIILSLYSSTHQIDFSWRIKTNHNLAMKINQKDQLKSKYLTLIKKKGPNQHNN